MKRTQESLAEDALARLLNVAYEAATTTSETNRVLRDEGLLRTALFGRGGAFGERHRAGKSSRRINQMEIGVTKELRHGENMRVTTLDESRGVLAYSLVSDGIRMEVITGDGLDTYYFDVPAHAIEFMGCMLDSAPAGQK